QRDDDRLVVACQAGRQQGRPLDALEVRLDADLGEVVLQDGGDVREGGRVDVVPERELEVLAGGDVAHAVPVGVGDAQFVQGGSGRLEVEHVHQVLGVLVGGAVGRRRGRAGDRCKAVVDVIDDALAVDGELHRATEAHVGEHAGQVGIGIVEVERQVR